MRFRTAAEYVLPGKVEDRDKEFEVFGAGEWEAARFAVR